MAGYSIYFLKIARKRIEALEATPAHFNPVRYAAPETARAAIFPQEIDSDVDIVGAWALEEQRMGQKVDDAEIELQRRMRLEAGL